MSPFLSPRALDASFRRYVKKGDGGALARAFDLAAPELLRTARHLCSDEAEAEDAVQSAFLVAIEKAASWDMDRAVMPWLVGLLSLEVKRARELARKGALQSTDDRWLADRIQGPGASPDPRVEAVSEELREIVEDEIEGLPDSYRTAVRGHLLHGAAPKDLAEGLGISVGALHVRLHRGLRMLRGALPAGAALSAGLMAPPARGLAAIRSSVLGGAGVHGVHGGIAAGGASGTWFGSTLLGSGLSSGLAGGLAAGAVIGVAALAAWGGFGGSDSERATSGGRVATAEGAQGGGDLGGEAKNLGGGLTPPDAGSVLPPGGGALPVGQASALGSVDRSLAGKDPRFFQPTPVATSTEANAGIESDEVWLERFRSVQGYTRITGLGARIIDLGPGQALPLIQRLYDRLPTASHRAQVLKAFHFYGGTDYVLDVLHLGAVHSDAEPRQHAMAHLQSYAFQDFSDNPEGYLAWRESSVGLDRAEVLRRGAASFAARLQAAHPAQLAELLASIRPGMPQILEVTGVDLAATFREYGMVDRASADLGGSSAAMAAPWFPWVKILGLSPKDLRERVLPWGMNEDLDVADSAFAALRGTPWLADELCSLIEQDPSRAAEHAPLIVALATAGTALAEPERRALALRLAGCLQDSVSAAAREAISTRVLCRLTGREIPIDDRAADWLGWLAWLEIEFPIQSKR